MKNDKFYKKDQMAENVDKLMYDLTEFTTDRRERDAERLEMIRDKQMSDASVDNAGHGILGKFIKNTSKIDRNNAVPKARIRPEKEYPAQQISDYDRGLKYNKDSSYNKDFDCNEDDATVLMDEFEDDDATVIMTDSTENERDVAELIVEGAVVAYDLTCGSVSIGSSQNNSDLVLHSRHVSRCHAVIGFGYVMDVGSKNGTYINGKSERISPNMKYDIHAGDRVVFADVEVIIKDFRREYGTI